MMFSIFFVSLFKVAACTKVYEFVGVNMAKYVYEIRYSWEETDADPICMVGLEKHEKLCASAKTYASLREEVILRNDTGSNYRSILEGRMKPFAIHHLDDTWVDRQLCLKCQTVPLTLLCSQECSKGHPKIQLQIIVRRSMFLNGDFLFNVDIADNVELVPDHSQYSQRLSRYPLLSNPLFSKFERWEMCIAAKSSIRIDVTLLPGDNWIENFGFYRITNPNGRNEIILTEAFPCNSSPRMYIRASRKDFHSHSSSVRMIPVVFQLDEVDTKNSVTRNAVDTASTLEAPQDDTMIDQETIALRDGSDPSVEQTVPVNTRQDEIDTKNRLTQPVEGTSNTRDASQQDGMMLVDEKTIIPEDDFDFSLVEQYLM